MCHMPEESWQQHARCRLIDAVQDPGNLGTMIRTADAAGLDAVVLGDGTADAFNGKTLRSAQGSHFHIPVVRRNLPSYVDELKAEGVKVYGTALQNGAPYQEIPQSESFALIVGNEGAGVDLCIAGKNGFEPVRAALRTG